MSNTESKKEHVEEHKKEAKPATKKSLVEEMKSEVLNVKKVLSSAPKPVDTSLTITTQVLKIHDPDMIKQAGGQKVFVTKGFTTNDYKDFKRYIITSDLVDSEQDIEEPNFLALLEVKPKQQAPLTADQEQIKYIKNKVKDAVENRPSIFDTKDSIEERFMQVQDIEFSIENCDNIPALKSLLRNYLATYIFFKQNFNQYTNEELSQLENIMYKKARDEFIAKINSVAEYMVKTLKAAKKKTKQIDSLLSNLNKDDPVKVAIRALLKNMGSLEDATDKINFSDKEIERIKAELDPAYDITMLEDTLEFKEAKELDGPLSKANKKMSKKLAADLNFAIKDLGEHDGREGKNYFGLVKDFLTGRKKKNSGYQ